MKAPNAATLKRRQAIAIHEIETARAIAARVVEKPTLSAWMILIPLVFVHYLQRRQVFKSGVTAVAESLLITKVRALDQACAALPAGGTIPATAPAGTTDDNERVRAIRAAEAAEVTLLAAHYERLLQTGDDDYAAQVRHAYPDAETYRELQEHLQRAEHEVARAACATTDSSIGDAADLVERLARARSDVRREQFHAIYG